MVELEIIRQPAGRAFQSSPCGRALVVSEGAETLFLRGIFCCNYPVHGGRVLTKCDVLSGGCRYLMKLAYLTEGAFYEVHASIINQHVIILKKLP